MNPIHNKSLRAAVLVTLLLAAAGVVFAVTRDEAADAAAPPPPAVSVAKVVAREFQPWDEFTGRVSAVETVELRPRVSGYIEQVAYEEGHEVRKGDLLFVIDQRRYRAAYDRAVAELERARSEARLAATELERAQTLLASRAISREEFDARRAAHTQGDASVRAAAAAVESARLDLQFTEVRSPIDGRAGRALVTVGNLAQADSTLLTTVVSLDPMYAAFDADEQTFLEHAEQARNGGAAARSSRPIRMALAGDDSFGREGRLHFLDNQLDPATGTIRVRAIFDNKDGALTPGLFVRLQMPGRRAYRATLVEDRAIGTDLDKRFVYTVDAKGLVAARPVTLGPIVDGLRVVRTGVNAGDAVIVNGVQRVRPGAQVQVQRAAASSPTVGGDASPRRPDPTKEAQ